MSATTAFEAALERKYQEEAEAIKIEKELQDDVEFEVDELSNMIIKLYEENGLYIDRVKAYEIIIEWAEKGMKE